MSTVDRARVRLKNHAALIRTSEGETENGAGMISGGRDVDEFPTWDAMKARRRTEVSPLSA